MIRIFKGLKNAQYFFFTSRILKQSKKTLDFLGNGATQTVNLGLIKWLKLDTFKA